MYGYLTAIHILRNGVALQSGTVLLRATFSDSRSLFLNAGDTIDFALGRGADATNAWDRVVLSARISVVPEPSTVVLTGIAGVMGLGDGFLGRRSTQRPNHGDALSVSSYSVCRSAGWARGLTIEPSGGRSCRRTLRQMSRGDQETPECAAATARGTRVRPVIPWTQRHFSLNQALSGSFQMRRMLLSVLAFKI
jgi:hypothetical protein